MDHYQTLGVAKTASPEEIKKAYRKLAAQHHPDKGGDTAKFQEVQKAYETLSDPQKKQQYDNPAQQGFHGGFPGGFGFNVNGVDINEIFGHMFRQHHQNHANRRQTYRTAVWVTLDQVYNGDSQSLTVQTPVGVHAINIQIPKGIDNGSQIRYDNLIEGATLIVEFRIHEHLTFERRGNDLYCNQRISVLDLIAGTNLEFTTISGKTFTVAVPPKTQPYMSLKISGQGMPIYNSQAFGDQILTIKPFIPDIIDQQIVDAIVQSKTK